MSAAKEVQDVPFLDLDAVEDEAQGKPSCTFKLGGRMWACRQPEEVPYAVVKSLVQGSESGEGTITRVDDFFTATLMPEQVSEFLAMLSDKEHSDLTLGKLQPLMKHVAENVLNRPTEPPAPSRAERRASSKKSTGA